MRYEGKIFRPGPNESGSYLLQVTMGCSHNKCRFCNFYKDKPFRVRPFEEIEEDLLMAKKYYGSVSRIFLCDGDPLCLSMDRLRRILTKIKEVFPESEYTRMYGTFRNAIRKTADDFRELRELGVDKIYSSLESGSDIVLDKIQKGITADEAVEAAERMDEAGISYGSTVILGLGGTEYSEEHIRGTIETLNRIRPTHWGFTVLRPQFDSPLYEDILNGDFELPTYRQIFHEEQSIFRGVDFYLNGKASRFVGGFFLPGNGIVGGDLPEERGNILKVMENRENQYRMILDQQIAVGGTL